MPHAAPAFLLDKWYLDCVSDVGDVFIGYAATVHWKTFAIDYASVMRQAERGGVENKTTLRKNPPPAISDDRISWRCDALGVAGEWTRLAPPIEHTLYETREGSVRWHCLMPVAAAQIATPGWPPLVGTGYVERLVTTIPVWKLPLDELRWGRFHAPGDDVIWIDWQGPINVQLVFVNGQRSPHARIDDTAIAVDVPSVTLRLDRQRVLRDGPIVTTALSTIPGIRDMLPVRTLNAHETKWCGSAVLTAGGAANSGWAIHEHVRWPGGTVRAP